MADQDELLRPRRKRGRFTRLEFPFPVPRQKNEVKHVWYYYEGFLRSNCVAVENVGDLTFLYKMVSVPVKLHLEVISKRIMMINKSKKSQQTFLSLLMVTNYV